MSICFPAAQKGRILLLFCAGFFTSLLLCTFFIRSEKISRVQNLIYSLNTVRGFQGLVLNSKGIGSLLISVAEKPGDIFVKKIELTQYNTQPLIREFYPEPGKFIDSVLTRIFIETQVDNENLKITLLLAISSLVTILMISFLTGIFSVGAFLFILDRKKHHEEFLISKKMEEMALQIAHDIRSPLAALNSMISRLGQLPEEERVIVRGAVNRITDIANHLLHHSKQNKQKKTKPSHSQMAMNPWLNSPQPSIQLLSSLIDTVVSEKRQQFRSKINIQIETILDNSDNSSYGLFANVDANELKRVLSNLVNNSVEALSEGGQVKIELLESKNNLIEIRVRDNGKGIPAHILPTLAQKGSSFGKKDGAGLGLYHAKQTIENWGGNFEIHSTPGESTCVYLLLPRAPAPNWFVEKFRIYPNACIVILDDDSSIHAIWDRQFAQMKTKQTTEANATIKMVHLSTPQQIRQWHDANKTTPFSKLFLVDYELLGFEETGLDLIETLGISKQSILVTSRFEEPKVRKRCEVLNVPLIPKGMAAFVPIEILPLPKKYDAILIDDDELVHTVWHQSAKANKKALKGFFSFENFLKETQSLDRASPIFVDSSLGHGIRGENLMDPIHQLGFESIFLATGYEPEHFVKTPACKGIVGKDPPWSFKCE